MKMIVWMAWNAGLLVLWLAVFIALDRSGVTDAAVAYLGGPGALYLALVGLGWLAAGVIACKLLLAVLDCVKG